MKKTDIVFVDKAAELQEADKKVLESLGYKVIEIVGNPDHAVRIVEEN